MSDEPSITGTPPRSRGWVLGIVIWGIFAGAPLVGFLSDHHAAIEVTVVVLAWCAFAALFLHGMITGRDTPVSEQAFPLIAALIALTVVLVAVGGDIFVGMAIFTSIAAGRRLPPSRSPAIIVALAAGVAAVLAAGGDGANAAALGLTTLGLGWWMIGFARLITTVRELHAAREEIARLAVNEERVRFARDLHDLLGHSLSLIALKSELAGRYLPDRPAEAATEVADISEVARRSLTEVREAVGGYRRPTLTVEVAGAREALAAAGIEVRADALPAGLPPDAEAVLAWTVREGATNVLRHAAARHVEIRVRTGGEQASVEVVDDGRGASSAEVDDGTGLAGLAERVARHHGRLEAAPREEGGFRLAVSVPLGAVA